MKLTSAPILAALLVVLCGCHPGKPESGAGGDRYSVDRLYPLRTGSVWTYDVETGDGSAPTLAITRVVQSKDGKAEVSSGGAPLVYEQRPDGLYRSDRAVYVFKLPLRVGATWDAGQGATAEVVSLDKQVSTVAGDFTGCVELRETGGAAQKVVRTVFCPDVGPVELESSLSLPVSGSGARVVARLRGYDFSAALSAP
ncbi:MAG: hypothetical protein JWN48_4709 [Myxococcaceae bacterium]|nr:hypothetical protein [Myxococcaceae bacterium]